MPSLNEWIQCDGLPRRTCNKYRAMAGLEPLPDDSNAVAAESDHTGKHLRGLGDVVDRVTSMTGIKRIVKAVSAATGVPCGCDGRRKKLNELFPLKGGDAN